jgi:hypothetical protein
MYSPGRNKITNLQPLTHFTNLSYVFSYPWHFEFEFQCIYNSPSTPPPPSKQHKFVTIVTSGTIIIVDSTLKTTHTVNPLKTKRICFI